MPSDWLFCLIISMNRLGYLVLSLSPCVCDFRRQASFNIATFLSLQYVDNSKAQRRLMHPMSANKLFFCFFSNIDCVSLCVSSLQTAWDDRGRRIAIDTKRIDWIFIWRQQIIWFTGETKSMHFSSYSLVRFLRFVRIQHLSLISLRVICAYCMYVFPCNFAIDFNYSLSLSLTRPLISLQPSSCTQISYKWQTEWEAKNDFN